MKRRSFFGAMAAVPIVAGSLAAVPTTPVGKYGYVDVPRAQKLGILYCEVLVDGVVVDKCVAFNDVEGWADFHYRGEDGKLVVHWHNGDGQVATRRTHGVVTVRKVRRDA